MSIENQVEVNGDELKALLTHIISNNQIIQKDGKNPIATEIVGESGLGKTSNIIQLAEELKLDFVKLNLAQIDELGDLVGFPVRQFLMEKPIKAQPAKEEEYTEIVKKEIKMKKMVDGNLVDSIVTKEVPVKKKRTIPAISGTEVDEIWVDETAIAEFHNMGYTSSRKDQNKRMSYCPPEWIAGVENGGILLLDDWNRADLRFIQAVMELVDRQEYISWKLPKNWHILLSANPDNGDYLVTTIDVAQRTRFASVQLQFDPEVWAKWAEHSKIDGRCINFLLMNPEVVTQRVNPRSITNFFNSISSITEFEKNLGLIQNLGESMIGPEAAMLFTQFIANKLDQLITPKEMLLGLTDKGVVSELKKLVWEGNEYRSDLASVFSNRLANYASVYSQNNPITPQIISRLTTLIKEEDLFNYDLKYVMAKRLISDNKTKFQKLILDKEVSELVTT
tara:strand:- start:4862 stop:6211 length:1350 start_codon:yes stop_codon:yes gene_type:complete